MTACGASEGHAPKGVGRLRQSFLCGAKGRDMTTSFTLRNTDWAAEFVRFANFLAPAELHETATEHGD